MKAVNIRWDTSDGNGNDEPVDLPTEMDIPEIASLCGFSTPNYFIATFYHEKKMTPLAFRRKKR